MDDREQSVATTGRLQAESDEVELVYVAAEAGYFEVPREISLVELAKQEGISDVEASEQLRRGVKRIVADSDV